MSNPIERTLEEAIFKSRWLLAPFYLGLIVSIALLLIKFVQDLSHLIVHILDWTGPKRKWLFIF